MVSNFGPVDGSLFCYKLILVSLHCRLRAVNFSRVKVPKAASILMTTMHLQRDPEVPLNGLVVIVVPR